MKKYMKIIRHGKAGTQEALREGSNIVIMEKVDGANASFKREGDQLLCFSRNNQLSENDTLRGFYNWAQENIDVHKLGEGEIFYGEWLVKHKLDYGDNANKFYLFDVYDENIEQYMPLGVVKEYANELEINLVPVFYDGEFQSLEHVLSFVGKSVLGKVGEGIVVKNYSYAANRHGEQQFTKIVSDEFAEVKQVKKHRVAPTGGLLDEFVNSNLTHARVGKILHKLVDENILEEDYDITDMGTILKNAGTRVYEDIIEEELDSLLKHVKAKIGKQLPIVVKDILINK